MSNYFKHKMRGKSPIVIAGIIIFGIIAISALAILFGFVIMWLWNWLMPVLFGLPLLTYWQAVGLFILAKLLLGGLGNGGGSGGKSKRKHEGGSCRNRENKKTDFSKWEHYDKFWNEVGDKAYHDYVAAKEGDSIPPRPNDINNDFDDHSPNA